MSVILFRAVSIAEFFNLLEFGVFKSGPNSVDGKHFAESPQDAEEWGSWLYDEDDFRIVAVELPEAEADKLMRWDRLDAIGPARFAELHELENAVITVMK
jgi:hypothetical protein